MGLVMEICPISPVRFRSNFCQVWAISIIKSFSALGNVFWLLMMVVISPNARLRAKDLVDLEVSAVVSEG